MMMNETGPERLRANRIGMVRFKQFSYQFFFSRLIADKQNRREEAIIQNKQFEEKKKIQIIEKCPQSYFERESKEKLVKYWNILMNLTGT